MPDRSFCTQLSMLITANADASAKYYRHTTALMKAVDSHDRTAFAAIKQECETALQSCAQTKAAIKGHRHVHGC